MERIVCAANKVEGCCAKELDGIYAGVRHAYCFVEMGNARENFVYAYDSVAGVYGNDLRVDMLAHTTQGFLTNLNRFVDRKEALKIAVAAGQIVVEKLNPQDELLSEDLY